jgi:putative heme iron utilization protein
MTTPDPAASRLERTGAWVLTLRSSFKTIILGTASPAGEPEASVAAAILAPDGSFRIFVSGLAAHTRQLLETGRASVLLAEDEAATAQPLARRRLTFACTATAVPRDHPEFAPSLQALREKLGPAFDLLTGLGDFQLIRLAPQRGRLVAGFGEAYEIDPQDWSRLTPLGRPRP